LLVLAWFELAVSVYLVGAGSASLVAESFMAGFLGVLMGLNGLTDSLDWARRGRLLRRVRPGEVSVEARWWFLPHSNKTDARPLGQSALIVLGAFIAAMWAPGNPALDGVLATLAGIALFLGLEARRRRRPA
jgi:hypothetical protein